MSLLLGVPDRQVNSDEITTWETNKVGGTPDWFNQNTPLPCCPKCQRKMTLVTQVYCPLSDSPFHRCLHIFVCPVKPCSLQSEGWRVIRTQLLDERSSQQAEVSGGEEGGWTTGQDDWGVDQDDWGQDCEDFGQADDPPSTRQDMTDRLSEMRISNNLHPAARDDEELPQSESSDRHSPRPGEGDGTDSPSLGGDGDVPMGGTPLECTGFRFATAGGGSVVGVEPSEEVEAEAVAVAMDEEGLQRMVGLLAGGKESGESREGSENTMTDAVGGEAFPAYYLNVFAEAELEDEMADHVATLLKDYQQREGPEFSSRLSAAGGQQGGSTETYDKTEVKHGDRQCYKFIKRLQACPQQCIRYQWNGSPLLMSKASAPLAAGRCEQCQAPRLFELQLVPPLIPLLKFPAQSEPQVEFGTVLVYTCSRSCWSVSETCREEVALLQHDPDQHLFK
ncbi:programmed cell death protein 2-like isoform X2 [Babylonia areolata]|uniref:programmed cell death protein 2-like isoform X2 n=1 Tax=Babylonia areolata TaxID=304850 RepID=UPI003FD581D7